MWPSRSSRPSKNVSGRQPSRARHPSTTTRCSRRCLCLTHAALRRPLRYRASRRLKTTPSRPCALVTAASSAASSTKCAGTIQRPPSRSSSSSNERRARYGRPRVYLAGDPPPLGRAGVLRGAIALRTQRSHELSPRAYEEAPAEDDARDQYAGPCVGPVATSGRVQQRAREGPGDQEPGDDGTITATSPDRCVEGGSEVRAGGREDHERDRPD